MNFFEIVVQHGKNKSIDIFPDFHTDDEDSDLMIRGKSFYAVWNEEKGIWSQNEYDVRRIVDKALMAKKAEIKVAFPDYNINVKRMVSGSSGMWSKYSSYVKQQPDRYVQLDDKLTFADTETKKSDYVSHRLPYSLKPGSHDSYDEIMSTLYSPENREKLEWAIGSVLSGDSKKIQKFIVLYGKGGTGKGTVLKIIEKLFDGYVAPFTAKSLANSNKDFSMESFKINPLVAIDEDGDLSKIEDSTKINSIVSHERILMNEKNKPQYPYTPHCFLFIASNEPVKIKDAESGLIRRLIDVEPTGVKIPARKYNTLMERVEFELGAIAYHCLEVYKKLGRHKFDNYKPRGMMYRTNAFINFIMDRYDDFYELDGITLSNAYLMWNKYCADAGLDPSKMPRHVFGEELKNYFNNFEDRTRVNGEQVRSWYSGFIKDCLTKLGTDDIPPDEEERAVKLEETTSPLDILLADCKAQYAKEDGSPEKAWDKVTTKLKDLDTKKLHWLLGPSWLMRVDFDLKGPDGKKDAKLNREAADKWPKTYAEYSKSGAGIHLYYRYTGDLDAIKALYAPDIELKINRGKAGIRRQLSKCNNEEIATLSSGLPVKEKKVISKDVIENERHLINLIQKAMRSVQEDCKDPIQGCEHHVTACCFIKDILDQAYASGMHYDLTTMRKNIRTFGMASHNSKDRCAAMIREMKFHSEDVPEVIDGRRKGIAAVFDSEVLPNLSLICWKIKGKNNPVIPIFNPTPEDIEHLLEYDLFGFNCRRYDNHIMHAIRLGYRPNAVYGQSNKIVNGSDNAFFQEAWDYSKADIFDYSSEKKSLKKFEIQMQLETDGKVERARKLIDNGMSVEDASKRVDMELEELKGYLDGSLKPVKHREMGVDWNKPLPEKDWPKLAEYCMNDVIATEALMDTKARQADWKARQILAAMTGMNTNSTTNSLTTRFIFGTDQKPQSQFNYRFMGTIDGNVETYILPDDSMGLDKEYTLFDSQHRPVFPGYRFERRIDPETGKPTGPFVSTYRGEEVGEGGYVYAEPGIYSNVALLDIASMHPSSIVAEKLFGETYTKHFADILQARIYIKHKQYDEAGKLFNGALSPYLSDPKEAKALSQALKIAINSVYGLTSAKFDNPFRDIRNKDNIVAKRGALFMINLKHEVQRRGFTVAHIKTDSIKIPNATPEIIKFVMDYGKLYGYNFEHEATYERMCLVNDAVYIAKYDTKEAAMKKYGYIPGDLYDEEGEWTATGTQFQVPYVFKKLFTHDDILLVDMVETKSVTTSLYLDFNENLSEGEHNYLFVGKCGAFCPVKAGTQGGELCREKDGKYYAATGSKGYRWKEYEVVRDLGLREEIDTEYYENLCRKAVAEIERFGPFDVFISPEPLPPWDMNQNTTKVS